MMFKPRIWYEDGQWWIDMVGNSPPVSGTWKNLVHLLNFYLRPHYERELEETMKQ